MKKILILLLAFTGLNCFAQDTKGWTNLLDSGLSNWDSYLSYRFYNGYNGEQPKDATGNLIAPIGLNKDDYGVFTVADDCGEPVLKISGEIYGCVVTRI